MSRDAVRARQELRRSNAAVPHRNRYREAKSGSGLHREAVDEFVDDLAARSGVEIDPGGVWDDLQRGADAGESSEAYGSGQGFWPD